MSSVLYHRDYTEIMKELVAELGMTLEQHNMTLGCIMLTIHAYMLSYFVKARPTMLKHLSSISLYVYGTYHIRTL